MKIITCASYGASGSSALTDLVSEYSNVHRMSSAEFRFLHDPDGVSDLEFQLIECHNRHNAGRALKRFWNLCKHNGGNWLHKRYETFFGGKYLKISKEYIDGNCNYNPESNSNGVRPDSLPHFFFGLSSCVRFREGEVVLSGSDLINANRYGSSFD